MVSQVNCCQGSQDYNDFNFKVKKWLKISLIWLDFNSMGSQCFKDFRVRSKYINSKVDCIEQNLNFIPIYFSQGSKVIVTKWYFYFSCQYLNHFDLKINLEINLIDFHYHYHFCSFLFFYLFLEYQSCFFFLTHSIF